MHRTPRRTPWSISTTVNPETFFGIFDDVASALDFDDKSMAAVVSNIQELNKDRLPEAMQKCPSPSGSDLYGGRGLGARAANLMA
jgi:hypothetical protein